MSNNYDSWAGRDSIFRNKLSNLRNQQNPPARPAAAPAVRQLANEKYIEQVATERVTGQQPVVRSQPVEELERLALYDEVTELYNLRHFMRTLTYELKRGERYKRPLAITIVSIDGLPQIRNQFGQDAADSILKSAVKLLKMAIRETDIAARHGDNGFAVILPETSASGITTAAERIRQQIRSQPIMYAMQQFNITASVGASAFPVHSRKAEELMGRAVQSMQLAVERGGDRVCII